MSVSVHLLPSKVWSLRYCPGQGNILCCIVVLFMGEGVLEGTILLAQLFSHFLSLPLIPIRVLCPFSCWFPGGWACVHFRTLWTSPMVSLWDWEFLPSPKPPQIFYSQEFWVFKFPVLKPSVCGLSLTPAVHPGLSACECGIAPGSTALPCCSSSLSQLLISTPPTVWMNVSLGPWL